MYTTILLTILPLLAAAAPTYDTTPSSAANTTVNGGADNLSLIQSLILAPKAVDRIKLIPNDADFVFDFNNPPSDTLTTGKGGHTVRADRQSFPPLIGTGVSMTVGFLGPCGFNTPHIHPRSSEINIVVKGSLVAEFTLENGARTVTNTVLTNQMTVFPQGALHTEFNPDCTDALFVAGFGSEDPGVQQEAQTFFGFGKEAVEAAVGNGFTFEGGDVDKFRAAIPANVALGVESCLKKCGIAKNK
jgi:mannose-6-phosphate isomerase-like protein (cupin superfamily)